MGVLNVDALSELHIQQSALLHCNELSRISSTISLLSSKFCEVPCAACIAAMRVALRPIGEVLNFAVPDSPLAPIH